MNQNDKELINMREYLKSLELNDVQCYAKKLILTTGKCLLDPFILVVEE